MGDVNLEHQDDENLALLDEWLKEESPETLAEMASLKSSSIQGVVDDQDLKSYPWQQKVKDWIWHWLLVLRLGMIDGMHYLFRQIKLFIVSLGSFFYQVTIQQKKLIQKAFQGKSIIHKTALMALLLCLLSLPYMIYQWILPKLLQSGDTVITQFDPMADEIFNLEPGSQWEDFFHSSRKEASVYMFPRMVVNLLATPNYPNPMAAVELAVESRNPHPLIYIKNHEGLFREILIQEMGKFSIEELQNSEGKKNLLKSIQDAFSKQLPNGQLTGVYFQTFVFKP